MLFIVKRVAATYLSSYALQAKTNRIQIPTITTIAWYTPFDYGMPLALVTILDVMSDIWLLLSVPLAKISVIKTKAKENKKVWDCTCENHSTYLIHILFFSFHQWSLKENLARGTGRTKLSCFLSHHRNKILPIYLWFSYNHSVHARKSWRGHALAVVIVCGIFR